MLWRGLLRPFSPLGVPEPLPLGFECPAALEAVLSGPSPLALPAKLIGLGLVDAWVCLPA